MKKDNKQAILLLILPIIFGLISFALISQNGMSFIAGTLIGSQFFMMCFILQHEFGHNSFFNSTKLNHILGHLTSFFTFIPFYAWKYIHRQHHTWTGYRDLDPTTEKTFESTLNPSQVKLVNFCWKYYVPLFTLGYRFGTYWNTDKLKRHLTPEEFKQTIKNRNLWITSHLVCVLFLPEFYLRVLPALYLSFIFTDLVTLSQHASIDMKHSHGKNVDPIKYVDQIPYTRSIKLNNFYARYFLFNMNYHEAHHAYPGLPCYHLEKVDIKTINTIDLGKWLKEVKSQTGVDYVFH